MSNLVDTGQAWESPARGGENEEADGEAEEKACDGAGHHETLPCRQSVA